MARFRDTLLRLLGSSSGETVLKAAATASGTLTLPAGTTDFSATGGTSQVVKQTSAGSAFTVGQLANADLSDYIAPTSFTPTISSSSGTITTYTVIYAKYSKQGKVVRAEYAFTINNNGTGSGFLFVDLPPVSFEQYVFCDGRNASSGAFLGGNTQNLTQLGITTSTSAYPVATGDVIVLNCWYFTP